MRRTRRPGVSLKRILVVYTGGTIGMRLDEASGGLVPALSGAELVELDPALRDIALLEVLTWGMRPSTSLSFADVIEIAEVARRGAERDDVDGVVVVQGSDLLEETAFALDLLLDVPKPVVVVSAMRAAEEPGSDARGNLRDAVRLAASPVATGVLVVAAGEIHSAQEVAKVHATDLVAFASPNGGPLGRVSDAGVDLEVAPRGAQIPPPARAARVSLIMAGLDVGAGEVEAALALGAEGIVVAAAGSGQTDPSLLEACRHAMRRDVAVVLATRCLAGSVGVTYAYPGGGAQWARSGAILAGTLSPTKSRVALALALGAGFDRARLEGLFERYRALPSPSAPGDSPELSLA
jgi:L-asparaginase